jgi:flagellar motor component MotA
VNVRRFACWSFGAAALGGPAIAWSLGWHPTLPISTSPWLVAVTSIAASGGAIAMSAWFRLADIGDEVLRAGRPLTAAADELARIAERARREGVLVAAADPNVKVHPVLEAGFLLLLRDPDEGLLRASLEIEGEVIDRDRMGVRSAAAWMCRVGLALLPVAAATVAGVMASHVSTSVAIPTAVGGIALAIVLGFFLWHAVSGGLAQALERRNAEQTLMTEAMIQTMLAIRLGEDYRTVRARLARLLPDACEPETASSVRLAA